MQITDEFKLLIASLFLVVLSFFGSSLLVFGLTIVCTIFFLIMYFVNPYNSYRDSVGSSVYDSVRDSVGDSVSDSVRSSVWDSVWDSVRDSVWDSVRDSVNERNNKP
jgi:hypothetical protein